MNSLFIEKIECQSFLMDVREKKEKRYVKTLFNKLMLRHKIKSVKKKNDIFSIFVILPMCAICALIKLALLVSLFAHWL